MLRHRHHNSGGTSGTLQYLIVPVARGIRCLVPGYGSRAYCAGGTVALIFIVMLITHTFLLTVLTQQYYNNQRHRDLDISNDLDINLPQAFERRQNEDINREPNKQSLKDNSSRASKHLLAASEYNYDKPEQSASDNTLLQKQYHQNLDSLQVQPIETFVVNVETVQERVQENVQDRRNPKILHKRMDTRIPLKSFQADDPIQSGAKLHRFYREGQYKIPESVVEVNIDQEKKDEDWEAHEDMSLEHLIVASEENQIKLKTKGQKAQSYNNKQNKAAQNRDNIKAQSTDHKQQTIVQKPRSLNNQQNARGYNNQQNNVMQNNGANNLKARLLNQQQSQIGIYNQQQQQNRQQPPLVRGYNQQQQQQLARAQNKPQQQVRQYNQQRDVRAAENQRQVMLQQRFGQMRTTPDSWLPVTTKAPSPNLLKQAKLRLSLQMRKKHKLSMFQKPTIASHQSPRQLR